MYFYIQETQGQWGPIGWGGRYVSIFYVISMGVVERRGQVRIENLLVRREGRGSRIALHFLFQSLQ